jgi:hypothetical protein
MHPLHPLWWIRAWLRAQLLTIIKAGGNRHFGLQAFRNVFLRVNSMKGTVGTAVEENMPQSRHHALKFPFLTRARKDVPFLFTCNVQTRQCYIQYQEQLRFPMGPCDFQAFVQPKPRDHQSKRNFAQLIM